MSRTTGQTTYGDKILIEKRLLTDSSSFQQTADISNFRMDTLEQQRLQRANKIRMPTEILSRNPHIIKKMIIEHEQALEKELQQHKTLITSFSFEEVES